MEKLPSLAPWREQIPKGKYRHYKGGEYTVLDVGYHSETEEETVIYQSAVNGKIWVRPKWMFCEFVNIQGVPRERFSYIG